MFKSISLNFTENKSEIKIETSGITVIVGPNNSGKSLFLREIEQSIEKANLSPETLIVKDLEINWPSLEDFNKLVKFLEEPDKPVMIPGHKSIARYKPDRQNTDQHLNVDLIKHAINTNTMKEIIISQLYKHFVLRLDGRTRFDLTDDKPAGDLLGKPNNLLSHIFVDDSLRTKLRDLLYDALNIYLVVDPTQLGILKIKLSVQEPTNDEQSLNESARNFYKSSLHIKDASDGVQAYVGVLSSIVAGDYRLICVDEPEAFLHPPLARKLGAQLSQISKERSVPLIIATHSADFLMGCIQSGAEIQILRFEYSNQRSKATFIDAFALNETFRSPLLRSSNIISSLFYDGVVITESDNDRAFYAEIYYRLSEERSGKIPSILFVNAQNKQTVKNIMKPLRHFGVPAAAIVDIDVIKDGGKTWSDWLSAANIPYALHESYAVQRNSIVKCFQNSDINMKTEGGVFGLPSEDQEAAQSLFESLKNYGIFVVDRGELESWLPNIKAIGKKTDWTISALTNMGSDPSSSNYTRPTDDDVWSFLRSAIKWISDPRRRGTS